MARTTQQQLDTMARNLSGMTGQELFVERGSGIWSLRYKDGTGEAVVFYAPTAGEMWNRMRAAMRVLELSNLWAERTVNAS